MLKTIIITKHACINGVAQVVVNCNKMFTYLFVGPLGSLNDSKVLCTFTLYINVQYHGLFDGRSFDGFFFSFWVIKDIH
jgi:hypothetical protein